MSESAHDGSFQLRLPPIERFAPLPLGEAHYVPVLLNKKGELDALEQASDAAWSRFTPLIQIVKPRGRGKAVSASGIRAAVKRLARVVGSRPFFLDIARLSPTHPIPTPRGNRPLLRYLHDAARRRALEFVPVLHVGDTDAIALVRETSLCDGGGAALRWFVRGTALSPGPTMGDRLRQYLTELAIGVEETDLFVDFEHLSEDIVVDPADIQRLIATVHKVGTWRSLVLLGTSIPRTMGCIQEGHVGSLPRREWQLWASIRKLKLPRVPTFGDYAIQHPLPPQNDNTGPGMRANIRYTTNSVTLVARGQGLLVQEGRQQYRELCRKILNLPQYSGEDYTWGDRVIADCARGLIEPGAQDLWRGVGTSHHLRFVTDEIAALYA